MTERHMGGMPIVVVHPTIANHCPAAISSSFLGHCPSEASSAHLSTFDLECYAAHVHCLLLPPSGEECAFGFQIYP